ncbi:hypothetical protein [Pedobacter sp. SYP-B3415]|uniref:hypothetical protein n=1 Tax=Pedobacter sp. SYP-B3415 TaxID=2496641 RepID=UPI00101C9A24|nr:hypothetical protein [Pedobacter sp. SYP-B3415]
MKKTILNLTLAACFAFILLFNISIVDENNSNSLRMSFAKEAFADETNPGSDPGDDGGGGGDNTDMTDWDSGGPWAGGARRVAIAIFHCSGTAVRKVTTYKNAQGQITGTVEFFRGSVTGSAGANWTNSTTVESTERWTADLQGNSCPSGSTTCTPVNPCTEAM